MERAVGCLKFDLLVAWACAARQSAHTNDCRISVPVTAEANRILPSARGPIGRRRVVDDVLDYVAIEVDAPHPLGPVGFPDPVRIMTIHTLDMLLIGKPRVLGSAAWIQ